MQNLKTNVFLPSIFEIVSTIELTFKSLCIYSLQGSFGVRYHYFGLTNEKTGNWGRLSSLSKTTQLVGQD